MAERLQFVAQLVDKISGPSRKIVRSMQAVTAASQRVQSSATDATRAQANMARQLRQTGNAARLAGRNLTNMSRAQRQAARVSRFGGGKAGGGGGGEMGLAGAFSVAALAAGWFVVGRAVVQTTAAIAGAVTEAGVFAQRSRAALGVVAGSASAGAAEFEMLRGTVADLGLDMQSTVAEYQRLRNVGFAADEANEITRLTADLQALGTRSEQVGSIMNALGKIKATGALQGDELNMLAEAGVDVGKIYQRLADSMGITIAEVKKLKTAGKIAARPAIDAIKASILEVTGGQQAGDAAKKIVGTTIDGAFRQLSAKFQNLMIDLGDAVTPALVGMMGGVREMVAALEGSGELKRLTRAFREMFEAVAALAKASGDTNRLTDAVAAFTTVLSAAATVVKFLADNWRIVSSVLKGLAVVLGVIVALNALALLPMLAVLAEVVVIVVAALWGLWEVINMIGDAASSVSSALGFSAESPSQAKRMSGSGSVSNSKTDNRSWEVQIQQTNTFGGGANTAKMAEASRIGTVEALELVT